MTQSASKFFLSAANNMSMFPRFLYLLSSFPPSFLNRSPELNSAADDADIVTDYGWLDQDVPRYEITGDPLICIFDRSVHCMEISLGRCGIFRSTPSARLMEVANRVDRSKPFELIAKFIGGWPLEFGFRRLGEFLAALAYAKIPFESWTELTIDLPMKLELPYDETLSLVPLDTLTNLRSLKWKGHRQQLRRSWLPFTPSVLQSIHILHLTCDLSLEDCSYILYHSISLKELIILRIHRDLATYPVLAFNAFGVRVRRPCLESLMLTSDENIDTLMEPFDFPALRHIEFHLTYPTLATFNSLDIWKNVQTGKLDCKYISEDDANWIRDQLPPASQFYYGRPPWVPDMLATRPPDLSRTDIHVLF
ncbi:hypothetical protein J132_10840 [Termitomyces sp. J132]|nr:hypothetical protein J132_10840 [Termitomyces sp. J132]